MVFDDEGEAAEDDEEDEDEEEDSEIDFDEEDNENSDSDDDQSEGEENGDLIEGAARWKRNIANKAKESFIQRQLNAKNLHSVCNMPQ